MRCYNTFTDLQCHVIIIMKFLVVQYNFSYIQKELFAAKLDFEIVQFEVIFKTVWYAIVNVHQRHKQKYTSNVLWRKKVNFN